MKNPFRPEQRENPPSTLALFFGRSHKFFYTTCVRGATSQNPRFLL
uniref:Uncharacterized protein n=1 Tax=Utricularia reniformis TaxID=192314 RepID=A0A1Y0AZI4_9LAMI|nr:hypothetical protein AEK19_MT0264 [Utricularia reniformis]ART30541.1 hypothetical protein AEK19_MT0264 [Utricularia reniformis]